MKRKEAPVKRSAADWGARADGRARHVGGGSGNTRTRRASGLTLRMYESTRNTTVAVSVKAKAIHHAVVDMDVAAELTIDILLLRRSE